jgi:hypothetical protein
MRPIVGFRRSYLPLVMVYFAYGALGIIDVSWDMWVKERLTLTPAELAGIAVAQPAVDDQNGVWPTRRQRSDFRLTAALLHPDRGCFHCLRNAHAGWSGQRLDRVQRRFLGKATGERREVTLVYPAHADIEAGKISILIPSAARLLGLHVGQSNDWNLPSGQRRRYRIIAAPYQPEAAGDPG